MESIKITTGVTEIIDGAFYGCSSLSDVYYLGSETAWGEMTMGNNNECLTNATIHFNEGMPAEGVAGDIFGDDSINSKDATLLAQYLAGWTVVLGK